MNRLIACLWLLLVAGLPLVSAQTPSAQPSPPKGRPLLLVATFAGDKLVVRAASVTAVGTVVQAVLPDGSRNAWDRTALVATLPWYPEAELASNTVDLGALGKLYDNAAREHPEFAAGLFAEKAKVRAAAEVREQARATKTTAVLSARYDPASAYTVEELRARLRAADEAAALEPARRAEIVRAVAPFREHLANLEANKVFVDGQWRTVEEIRRQQKATEDETRRRTLAIRLELPLDAQLLDAGQVSRILWVSGLALGVPILCGFVLLIRRKRVLGAAFILMPLAGGAWCAFLLFSTDVPWATSPAADTDDGKALARVFEIATAGKDRPVTPAERSVQLGDADVNAFLVKEIKIRGKPQDGAVNLRKLAVRLRPGGVTLCETAEWHGRTLLIRQDFDITVSGAKPVVANGDAYVGGVPVPESVSGWLRKNVVSALTSYFHANDLFTAYAVRKFSDRTVDLVSTAPLPRATPAPVVAATPVPTPTETATPTPPMEVAKTPTATATPAEPENVEPELPPLPAAGNTPGPDNTFYIYAIWDGINSAAEDEIGQQMDRLRAQFGKGNRYHRVGFAFILSGNEDRLRTICNLARQKNLAIGVIMGTQTHTGAGKNEVNEDFRAVQWRLAGPEWRGGSGNRESMLPTPSRYCRLIRDALEKGHRQRSELLSRVMGAYPGVITCVNGVIEEELADGGQNSDDRLSDYSPFAVTEFRDWLRHRGMYDADGGKYAGQGAPERITGTFVTVKGKPRSPFYDATTPDTSRGGQSFNGKFGTNFKTWTLKYWDLEAFPARITDENFDPTPKLGKGFTDGGFDAPRKRGTNPWWQAWSWDYHDNGNLHPPDSAGQPAFGFRQVMVHNFVVDMFQVALRARLPANLMFAHQIPGELVGAPRDRSSASPAWTGYLPFAATVGVTRFGFFDPELALRYTKSNPKSRGWGIFEWHPMPNADPSDPKLYQKASDNLKTYYRAKCHHLYAGWWKIESALPAKDFPLADSQLAKAIKDFMDTRPDQPYPGTPR